MEALVIANEIIRMVRFLGSGIDISPTTLALDAIARVQPGAGFLTDDHTLENWKWAQWKPVIMDRNRFQRWEDLGGKDAYERANEYAKKLLKEHQPLPLSGEVEAVIADVLAERAATPGA
jgi:trimethylamine--corrinoid protein Co-methyltransferase